MFAIISFLALVLISGCIRQSAEAPEPSPAEPTSGVVTQAGSAEAFGEGIIKCTPGTPWEFTAGTQAGAYKASYTIEGKTQFKGSEYCRVKGKVEIPGATAELQGLSYDYYFKVDATGTTYSDIWFVMNIPGQPQQEIHIESGAAQQ